MNDDGVPIIGDQARRTMFCDICQQTRPGNLIATTKICIDMASRPVPKELGVAVQILKLCRDNLRCINQAQEWAGKRPTMPKIGDVVDLVDSAGRRLPAIVKSVWPCRTPGKSPGLGLVTINPDPLLHEDSGAPPIIMSDPIPHASAVANDGEDWEQLVDGLAGPFWVEPRDEAAKLRREITEHVRARERAEVRNEAGGKRLDDLAHTVRADELVAGKAARRRLADAIQAISDDLEDTAAGTPPLPSAMDDLNRGPEAPMGGPDSDGKITPIGEARKAREGKDGDSAS